MTKDGGLALLADLGQPGDVLALMVPLLVCPQTSLRKHGWLSFGGLLTNLAIFHHERVLVIRCIFQSMGTQTI